MMDFLKVVMGFFAIYLIVMAITYIVTYRYVWDGYDRDFNAAVTATLWPLAILFLLVCAIFIYIFEKLENIAKGNKKSWRRK